MALIGTPAGPIEGARWGVLVCPGVVVQLVRVNSKSTKGMLSLIINLLQRSIAVEIDCSVVVLYKLPVGLKVRHGISLDRFEGFNASYYLRRSRQISRKNRHTGAEESEL
jgi:hypothetical protein